MRIVLGSDHAGYEFRTMLRQYLQEDGLETQEVGASGPEAYDYPDASDEVVKVVLGGHADLGVLVCGTGIGVSIRANRYHGIRAALCCSPEMAALAREHNDANVVCLGARTTEPATAVQIVRTFVHGTSSSEPRHRRRIEKLDAPLLEK